MIIDAHVHFDPRLLDGEGIRKRMAVVGIDKSVLISRVTDPPLYTKPGTLMAMQRLMMRSRLLRPMMKMIDDSFHKTPGTWNPWYRRLGGRGGAFQILLDPDNQSVAEIVAQYPEQFYGWIFINPMRQRWQEELMRWQKISGMVGIKVHPFWHRYPLAGVEAVAKEAERYHLPLLVHLGFEKPIAVKSFCARHPTLPIIFAHTGVPLYQDLWKEVRQFPFVFIDLSSHHVDENIMRNAVGALGSERCLFGSDDPYGEPGASALIKSWIEKLPISADEKEGILGGNFARIINRTK